MPEQNTGTLKIQLSEPMSFTRVTHSNRNDPMTAASPKLTFAWVTAHKTGKPVHTVQPAGAQQRKVSLHLVQLVCTSFRQLSHLQKWFFFFPPWPFFFWVSQTWETSPHAGKTAQSIKFLSHSLKTRVQISSTHIKSGVWSILSTGSGDPWSFLSGSLEELVISNVRLFQEGGSGRR